VEAVNSDQKRRLKEKLHLALGSDLAGASIAVWGLTFKPNTDDLRESPALTLIEDLVRAGAKVCAHDPVAMNEAKRRLDPAVRFAETSYDAVSGADALVVVTDWNEYRHPDFVRLKRLLRRPIVIDGRNLYALHRMSELGFTYHSIGRPAIS
jgi:UDPglucose 6-dehydrogenase